MKINPDQWEEIRRAVELDDQRGFERMVTEFARIAVAVERSHQRICDQVRAREQGNQPYLASERVHR